MSILASNDSLLDADSKNIWFLYKKIYIREIIFYFRFKRCYFRYVLIVYLTLIPKIDGSIYFYIKLVQKMATSGLQKVTSGWLFQGHIACNLLPKVPWLYHVYIRGKSKGQNLER